MYLLRLQKYPVAKAAVSELPATTKAPNTRIIPTTVPIRPTKVPIEAQSRMLLMFLDNIVSNSNAASNLMIQHI